METSRAMGLPRCCPHCPASASQAQAHASRDVSRLVTGSLRPCLTSPPRASAGLPRHARAAAQGEPAAATPSEGLETAKPKQRTVIRRVTPTATPPEASLQTKSVEDASVPLEGVVRLESGGSLSLGQLALLAGGDAAALVLFAYVGRATHVSTAVDLELLKTALPFLIGWLTSCLVFEEYSPSRALPRGFGQVAGSTAKAWAVGVPLGIIIRSVAKGQLPQVPFMIVSMLSTAVFLTAWRSAFFSLAAKGSEDSGDAQDKSGNVFEFFELLTSLVKRW